MGFLQNVMGAFGYYRITDPTVEQYYRSLWGIKAPVADEKEKELDAAIADLEETPRVDVERSEAAEKPSHEVKSGVAAITNTTPSAKSKAKRVVSEETREKLRQAALKSAAKRKAAAKVAVKAAEKTAKKGSVVAAKQNKSTKKVTSKKTK